MNDRQMPEIQYQISNPAKPSKITQNGIYAGVSMSVYHSDCCAGPSVSKSALKWLLPWQGGSPKAFWGRWNCNPDHINLEPTKALKFGKAAHCLLLGDEAFNERFAIRPDYYPSDSNRPEAERRKWNGNSHDCKAWLEWAAAHDLTVITSDDIDLIRAMAADARTHPLVEAGALSGRVERTMVARDPVTGIWLKARPDSIPTIDGMFADLKTAADLSEGFLSRQIGDAGYYLQGAMIRMICRLLGIPFEEFWLIYVLKDPVPDTAAVRLSEFDLDRGEAVIRWCLHTIKACMDAGEWPGAQPFRSGERDASMSPWAASRIDDFLDTQAQLEAAE